MARLVLASASPRRRELLARVGVAFDVVVTDCDERVAAGEVATAYAARVARAKAELAAAARSGAAVLAADTVVEIAGEILGKAEDEVAAAAMLRRLIGQTHQVHTAFVLLTPTAAVERCVTTEVDLRPASPAELAGFVASGEWRGKAGAYALQGMAAAWVTAVRGSPTNVIGLPLSEVLLELERAGLVRLDFAGGTPS